MSVDISKINNGLFLICGIVLFLIVLLIFFVVLYRKRHNFFLKEKELIEIQHSQVLLQSQLELQEDIFTQISSEIHDNIGQVLSLARLNINTLEDEHALEKLNFTDDLLGQAISDLRNLSHNLNTTYIREAGLVAAIGKLLTSLENTGRFSIEFAHNEIEIELDSDKTIILFRIIQEAVNNIIKHAKATHIIVSIIRIEEQHRIQISDNGRGFDPAILNKSGHGIGIRNMLSRVNLIPATINISSQENMGTVITIDI